VILAEVSVRRERDESPPLEGKYANFFKVGFNTYEFILEFGQLYQSEEKPRIHSRIVTSPAYMRELFNTLEQAIRQHEQAEVGEANASETKKPS
jgi:hypothetical protein